MYAYELGLVSLHISNSVIIDERRESDDFLWKTYIGDDYVDSDSAISVTTDQDLPDKNYKNKNGHDS